MESNKIETKIVRMETGNQRGTSLSIQHAGEQNQTHIIPVVNLRKSEINNMVREIASLVKSK